MKVGDLVTWSLKRHIKGKAIEDDDVGIIISLSVHRAGSIRKGFDDIATRVRVWWGLNQITEHSIDFIEAA